MHISDATVEELLLKQGKVPQATIESLVSESKAQKKPLKEIVLKKQVISEKDLTKLFAELIDVPYIELTNVKIDRKTLQLIPDRIAQKYKAVVFEKTEDGRVKLAMDDPDDIQAIDFLQKQLGKKLEIYIAPQSDIEVALNDYRGSLSSEISKVVTDNEEVVKEEEEISEEDLAEDSPIAQTVNLIIEYAIKQKASDIHVEPHEEFVQIRYRIDGVLREANKLPRKVLSSLVSRIKILSNLKIDEHRAPQDGRFKIEFGENLFAIRVSTLPVMDGEKVVMRLLDESTQAVSLENLGFWGKALDSVHNSIAQPHGIILVTGPTGSGKSTTLYSALSLLNKPDVNISTIEDPVEYRLEGANQTQVNPKAGMTFAAGLRALLRQDPNIMMIGEIRDSETANLAVQAALTGHLVFSTLHTNNAATALPRLLDMGIEPFLIASTVRVIVGQRLLRKLNPDCRESYQPEGSELEELEKRFQIQRAVLVAEEATDLPAGKLVLSDSDPKNKAKQTKSAESDQKLEVTKSSSEQSHLHLWRAKRVEPCESNPYKGRIGIYEVLTSSETIQKMITSRATSDEIQQQAIKEGMITMQQDGFVKALQGLTTIEEILRVTRE
jgi:type IV pilus assembly protein PilB